MGLTHLHALEKRKEKTLNCEQWLSLTDGNTGEFYFFLEMIRNFVLSLRKNKNSILYSERNIKHERKTEMCFECNH